MLIATVFTDFKDNHYVAAAFKGMRPAVVALIAAPLIGMSKGMSWWKILLAVGAAAAIWLAGLSPIWFIFAGAVVGIAWSFRNEGAEERVDTNKGKEEKL